MKTKESHSRETHGFHKPCLTHPILAVSSTPFRCCHISLRIKETDPTYAVEPKILVQHRLQAILEGPP